MTKKTQRTAQAGHRDPRVTVRNARFQQWQSYLTTRAKRTKSGRFLIQGVRPLTLALEHDWPIETVLYRVDGSALSGWARGVLDGWSGEKVGVSGELMAELGEKADLAPELIAVAKTRQRGVGALASTSGAPLLVVFDRPTSPGNLGTLIRSADAFGADAVVVTGHAADPFDPQCVRASTGSLFALPVYTATDADEVLAMRERTRRDGRDLMIVGTDEGSEAPIFEHDFGGGTILVIGNETRGMSASWRAACDVTVSIPIGGAASSLGAPSAGAVCLYEIARQRRGASLTARQRR
ncbi:TrmH family RNA methyltransferase [Prescottella subtropica]|uniref:TrmH family RNA methyltransferase n=1 Tax=Prescottella subtropica TaxID=2545757 RepID=UPI001F4F340A|nr:TrmH family RNA methyltransferase [Prescottella subtropica]